MAASVLLQLFGFCGRRSPQGPQVRQSLRSQIRHMTRRILVAVRCSRAPDPVVSSAGMTAALPLTGCHVTHQRQCIATASTAQTPSPASEPPQRPPRTVTGTAFGSSCQSSPFGRYRLRADLARPTIGKVILPPNSRRERWEQMACPLVFPPVGPFVGHHASSQRVSSAPPYSPDSSGWNWQPTTGPRSTAATKVPAYSHRTGSQPSGAVARRYELAK